MENAGYFLFLVLIVAMVVLELTKPGGFAMWLVGIKRREYTKTWVTSQDEEE